LHPAQEADGVARRATKGAFNAKGQSMFGIRRKFGWLAILALIALVVGCSTTQPHVTAKVIFQQNDIAAEVSTEWR
jgi:hypothetical protein